MGVCGGGGGGWISAKITTYKFIQNKFTQKLSFIYPVLDQKKEVRTSELFTAWCKFLQISIFRNLYAATPESHRNALSQTSEQGNKPNCSRETLQPLNPFLFRNRCWCWKVPLRNMKPALKRHKRIPLLRIENSATTKRPTGPNAPCLSLVTHIEGKEGEAGTGRRKSFHKIQKKFFSSRDDTFLPTCPNRSATLNIDVN